MTGENSEMLIDGEALFMQITLIKNFDDHHLF